MRCTAALALHPFAARGYRSCAAPCFCRHCPEQSPEGGDQCLRRLPRLRPVGGLSTVA